MTYTYRIEVLPFGAFKSNGDYVGSSIKRENEPKLALGFSYDYNKNAARESGQKGRFIPFSDDFEGRSIITIFTDLMFKYKGFSVMGEYAGKTIDNDIPVVEVLGEVIATYYTGKAYNIQAGYLFDNNYEIAIRYTDISPDIDQEESRYTLGLSKYIVGHKLKVQTDITLRDRDSSSDQLIWRTQMDVHF